MRQKVEGKVGTVHGGLRGAPAVLKAVICLRRCRIRALIGSEVVMTCSTRRWSAHHGEMKIQRVTHCCDAATYTYSVLPLHPFRIMAHMME